MKRHYNGDDINNCTFITFTVILLATVKDVVRIINSPRDLLNDSFNANFFILFWFVDIISCCTHPANFKCCLHII